MTQERFRDIRSTFDVKLIRIHCPGCGGLVYYQVPEEVPVGITNPCPQCKRELNVRFDYNSFRVEMAYDSSRDT